jgi:hypothetical protein
MALLALIVRGDLQLLVEAVQLEPEGIAVGLCDGVHDPVHYPFRRSLIVEPGNLRAADIVMHGATDQRSLRLAGVAGQINDLAGLGFREE